MPRREGNTSKNPRLKDLIEISSKADGLTFEPRCKVCQKGQDFVGLVNSLLATGASYVDVLRAIEPVNAQYEEKRRVSYQSIVNHQKKHMPYDSYAVRKILEERAEKQGIDFKNAEMSIVTAAGYAQVMMKKGFERLVNDEEEVSVTDGLYAARVFNELTKGEDSGYDAIRMVSQLNRIIEAVKMVTTPEQMKKIAEIVSRDEKLEIEGEVIEEDLPLDDGI